jgi:two-component system, NtrC family, sensor kinase
MSVRLRLLIIVTFVALVPLGFLAYTTLGLHQDALRQKISEVHVRSAKYGATVVEANLERAVLSLKPTIETSIDWAALNVAEREGALWLLQAQLASIASVTLLDSKGNLLATTATTCQTRHTDCSSELQQQKLLAAELSVSQVLEQGFARGSPRTLPGTQRLLLPVGFRVPSADGLRVLLIAVDLAQPCAELSKDRSLHTLVMLTEANSRILCASPPGQTDVAIDPALAKELGSGARASLRYTSADGTEMLAAAATTLWGFRVVVAQPLSEAFAASARMRIESMVWLTVGAVSAVGAGFLLARGITQPLHELSAAAALVARGEFGVQLNISGRDELAAVAGSFTRMAREIEAREREIRQWNEELRARVEQKTSELKNAQDALLESRKLAAMSALAAGVAHEINNPLTGIIGLTQVLLARSKKRTGSESETDMLQSVEREALRVRDIVSKMALLSQAREASGQTDLRPAVWVRDALNARRPQLTAAGIAVQEQFSEDVPSVLGNHTQLVQVLCEVIDNALKAMRGRPQAALTLALDALTPELVRVRVTDTGRGVASKHLDQVFEPFFTTKDEWQGQGLGLAIAYRIVEAHHGSIKLDSKIGQGATVTLLLPAKRTGAHLA